MTSSTVRQTRRQSKPLMTIWASLALDAIVVTLLAGPLTVAAEDDIEAAPQRAAVSDARRAESPVDEARPNEASKETSDDTIDEGRVTAVVDAHDRREITESQQRDCRSVKVTGSRIPKRICRTTEEWEAFRAQTAEAGQEMLRRTREDKNPPVDPLTSIRTFGSSP